MPILPTRSRLPFVILAICGVLLAVPEARPTARAQVRVGRPDGVAQPVPPPAAPDRPRGAPLLPATSVTVKTVAFQPSAGAVLNPDRGFYSWADPDLGSYRAVRAAGFTLVRQYFMLDAYRDQPLPPAYLNALALEFSYARQTGLKHIVRFAYNFGPYPNPAPDATQSRIEQHLQQLAPLFAANEDVISSFEAGFIGAWGEWHSSTNGLDTNTGAKAAILAALLAAVPPSRMIALRYPSDMQLLNGAPVTAAEAFSGSNRARVGSHQDCFLASDDDWGTWGRGGNPIAVDKAYVAENGRWTVVGGETCAVNPPRSSCPTALAELEMLHFSNLDVDYEPAVIQGFRNGGCYDEIDRRLGYRFELSSVSYPSAAPRGGSIAVTVQLRNTGYAAMFNARPVFVVVSNGTSRYVTPLAVDPRLWPAGASQVMTAVVSLPAAMAAGTYRIALWLPDQAASIRANPLYAVRFANDNVWDAATGENVIVRDLAVQ